MKLALNYTHTLTHVTLTHTRKNFTKNWT